MGLSFYCMYDGFVYVGGVVCNCDVCGFQGSYFFVCCFFVVGDNCISVFYLFVGRSCLVCNEGGDWFGDMFFDKCCGFFFGGIINFIDYQNCFSFVVFLELV